MFYPSDLESLRSQLRFYETTGKGRLKARTEAAERELEALRGQLAEAVVALREINAYKYDDIMPHAQRLADIAANALARLAPTEPKEDVRVEG